MKKKIALLLAAVMTLSLMPMTVFAGSSNYLAKGTLTLKPDTKYDGAAIDRDGKRQAIPNALVVEFKDAIPFSSVGQKFRVELTNAEFSNLKDASLTNGQASQFKLNATTYLDANEIPANAQFTTTNLGGSGLAQIDKDGVLTPAVSAGAVQARAALGIMPSAAKAGEVQAAFMVEGIPTLGTVTVYSAPKDSKLVLLLPISVNDVDDADVMVKISANNSYVSDGTFLLSKTASGSTKTTVKSIRSGRELIEINNILITESLIGSFKGLGTGSDSAVELIAPSGFEFVDSNVTVVGTGEFATLTTGNTDLAHKRQSLLVGINGAALGGARTSSVLPETIIIKDVRVQPIDNDNLAFGSTLQMGVYKYSGSIKGVPYVGLDGLTEQQFDACKAVDWAISVTAATAKDVVTGRFANRMDMAQQVTAKVTFKELIKDAWLSERTTDFTLPEGVIIRGVKFDDWEYIKQVNPASTGKDAFTVNPSPAPALAPIVNANIDEDKWTITIPAKVTTPVADPSDYPASTITVNKNVLSLKNLTVRDNEKAEIGMTLYLSISPEFKGDTVTLKTGGTAVNQDETPEVVIANCVQPITVSASKVTDVQIGFQRYAVGDITIKENLAGAILRNTTAEYTNGDDLRAVPEGLQLQIEDFITSANSDMQLVPVKESQISVTEGDLKVSLRKSTSGTILLDVDKVSTKPSTIVIKGLEVKIDRTVPYGVYDLVVAGQSVFANKANPNAGTSTQINSLHDVYGYSIPFINVATEGMNSPLKANVKIAKDSDIVIVDGVQQQMAYPTYFDVNQESFLVPARFISHIFGVEENNIFWNDTTKTVSIITANRTIQFTANSNIMVVGANGAPSNVTMTAKAILHPVTERLYVPFRAIGDAFGVPVSYDEATQMGEYNAVVAK